MKTGIVGGTFDPIHVAHSYLMEECGELLGLDRLLVIPNGDPPHKADTVTSGAHRLAMARLALAEYPGILVDDLEVTDPRISYTWLTLERLRERWPEDAFSFIMGADSLIQFPSWRRPERILELADLVCFDRPGYRSAEVASAAAGIRQMGGHVILIDSLEVEISSTEIRRRCALDLPHRSFLHPAVHDYIRDHRLYRLVGADAVAEPAAGK